MPSSVATKVADQPPVGSLFAAFLGENPVKTIVGKGTLASLQQTHPADAAALTGRSFFPELISGPFHTGLVIVFSLAIAMSVIGALASLLRGSKFVHVDAPVTADLSSAGAR